MATTRMALTAFIVVLVCVLTSGTTAAVAPIKLSDLPRNPETACASQPVKSALLACKLFGPTPRCCQKLDAVFANSSSESAGCLCIPKVLYGTITQASNHGLEVLTLLKSCQANSTAASPFLTQWATRDRTSCPNISIDARLGDVLADFGEAFIVPSTVARARWAWGNMLQFGEVMGELSDLRSVSEKFFGSRTLQLLFLVMICMPLVFFVLHHGILMQVCAAYRRLSQTDRLISCQHAVYAVVFGLSVVPQTVLAFRSLFLAWTGNYLISPELSVLVGFFIASRSVLYAAEAAVRSVVKWSWLLVVHHLMFFTIIVLALWSQNAAIVGIGIVLDLFACHEAPLYVALLAYRLQWPAKVARSILRGACSWYILTRLFQTVLLVYMIVGFAGMPAIHFSYEFIATSILCGALTVIQVYTLVIYKALDAKLTKRLAGRYSLPNSSKADAVPSCGFGVAACGSLEGSYVSDPGVKDVTVDISTASGMAESGIAAQDDACHKFPTA